MLLNVNINNLIIQLHKLDVQKMIHAKQLLIILTRSFYTMMKNKICVFKIVNTIGSIILFKE